MDPNGIDEKINDIRHLLVERLRVKGRSLSVQLRKAGRRLPRAVTREARYLAEVQSLAANPKLARRIDIAKVAAAHNRIREHLLAIDPKEARKDRILGLLGVLSFNLIVIFVLGVTLLWYRGII
jgi:hypothetical protein